VTDGRMLSLHEFNTRTTHTLPVHGPDDDDGDGAGVGAEALGGHGGGDYGLIRAFVTAVATNDPSVLLSGARESLASHLLVFAAEHARRTGTTVDLAAYAAAHGVPASVLANAR
jgi:hypothetical protein